MKINYNVSAIIANAALSVNEGRYNVSSERLSTGYKVNHAKENPSGIAIAKRMNAQLRGLSAAEQDAKDGESVVEIADGALAEVHDMLQRMNELAVKSANGSITDDDRAIIQDEVAQLKEEIARIGETTEYNGRKLFDGTFDLKGYTDVTEIKVNYYSDDVNIGKYELSLDSVTFDADGNVVVGENTKAIAKRTDTVDKEEVELSVEGDSEQLILKGEDGFEIRIGLSEGWETKVNKTGTVQSFDIDLTGMGAMTLQIGANEGQTIDLRIPELSLLNIGAKKTDVSTLDGANRAIDEIKNSINYVSQMRSRLGAYQNRLVHTENNLATSQENVTAAYSRIMDTDMAEEMTDYTNLQVVTQAATSILAQANERPSQVLQLLQ